MRLLLPLLFLSALFFTACGGGDQAPAETSSPASAPPASAVEPTGPLEEGFESGDTGELTVPLDLEEGFESGDTGKLKKVEEDEK